MEFASLDDKMDVASSPYPQLEEIQDLDFEFDQMDNQQLNPKSDNVMDDATEPSDTDENTAPVEDIEFIEEPNVNDEEEGEPTDIEQENDFEMEEAAQPNQEEQEEVLYDEEEEEESTVITNEPQTQDLKTNTQPVHETEQVLEPENILDTTVDEAQAQAANHEADPQEIIIGQASPEATVPSAPEEQVPDEEQTLRDDGDGPIVDPLMTEYHEGPGTAKTEQSTKAQDEVLLEESFEDELKAEHDLEPSQTDGNSFEPAPASFEAPQAPEADESLEVPADASDLHAVRLVYLGDEYSLFPPKEADSTSFFLSDPSLSFEPLAKLLESCGQILEGSIGHDDELVLDVPTMGLHICQDSKYASELSLHQILEVYLTLNRNETSENIAPLFCNLSSRICLGTQYKYLIDQAQKGTSFTDIVDEHADSPEVEEDIEVGVQAEMNQEIAFGADAPATVEDADDAQADANIVDAEIAQPTEAESADSVIEAPANDNIEEEQYFLEDFAAHDNAVDVAGTEAAAAHQQEGDSSHTVNEVEPTVDAEVSEYFDEALDEAAGEEDEELQEEAEDQSVLREAIADENDATQTLLAEEAAHDENVGDGEGFDANDFLISDDDDDEDTVEDETKVEATEVNGKHAAVTGSSAPSMPPTTPPKKTSKRKVNEDEDDLLLEMDTPEPKRRRPS